MKVTKTYSIEESIYNAFDYLTTEKKINKSSFIEDLIRKYLKDNDMDFIDKLYFLKSNPEHVVSVVSQDASFYQLNDGSRINKILFMTIFDEVTPVEPDAFLNSSNIGPKSKPSVAKACPPQFNPLSILNSDIQTPFFAKILPCVNAER